MPDERKNLQQIANLWSDKRIGFAAEILLRFLDSGNRNPDNPAFEAFQKYWRMDSQILPEQVWPMTGIFFTPGTHWHGDWEEDAKNLLTTSDGLTEGEN